MSKFVTRFSTLVQQRSTLNSKYLATPVTFIFYGYSKLTFQMCSFLFGGGNAVMKQRNDKIYIHDFMHAMTVLSLMPPIIPQNILSCVTHR